MQIIVEYIWFAFTFDAWDLFGRKVKYERERGVGNQNFIVKKKLQNKLPFFAL